MLSIRKTRTTPYHPQCDGLVERFKCTLHASKIIHSTGNNMYARYAWLITLMFILQLDSHHSILCLVDKHTYQLTSSLEPTSQNCNLQNAATLENQLTTAFETAHKQMGRQHLHQKEYCDKKLHGQAYQKGNLVWLHSSVIKKGQHRKLHHPWTGPYQVLEKISEATYRIKQVVGRRQCKIVYFDILKPCPSNIHLKNTPLVTADSQEENVEQLASPAEGRQHSIPSFGTNLQLMDNDDFDQQNY